MVNRNYKLINAVKVITDIQKSLSDESKTTEIQKTKKIEIYSKWKLKIKYKR